MYISSVREKKHYNVLDIWISKKEILLIMLLFWSYYIKEKTSLTLLLVQMKDVKAFEQSLLQYESEQSYIYILKCLGFGNIRGEQERANEKKKNEKEESVEVR